MSIPKIADYSMLNSASFPTNRATWQADPKRSVLLIHDMQRYFLQVYHSDGDIFKRLISNLVSLRNWARENSVPVVYTAQPHEQPASDRALLNDIWGPGLTAAETDLQQVVAELAPEPGDITLIKWRYSAFRRSDLLERMRGWNRDQLVIGGVYAHIGCMVTAIDAFMSDIQPFLVGDAVADFSEAEHRMALQYVATRCGSVVATASLTGTRSAATREWLRSRVLKMVEDGTELDPDENLIFYGLDSIQVMALAGELSARGITVGFDDLARVPTLNAWMLLIEQRQLAA